MATIGSGLRFPRQAGRALGDCAGLQAIGTGFRRLQHYADADGERVPESIVTYAMVGME